MMFVNSIHCLVINHASIRIVDGAMTTYHQLLDVSLWFVGHQLSKPGVALDDVGNAFGRVESSDLSEEATIRVLKLREALCLTSLSQDMHVVRQIPVVH